jgi:hypothetical protein
MVQVGFSSLFLFSVFIFCLIIPLLIQI